MLWLALFSDVLTFTTYCGCILQLNEALTVGTKD